MLVDNPEGMTRSPFFTYRARVTEIIDGDTLDMAFDLGFRVYHDGRVRLSGVDTAEIYGVENNSEEYRRGQKHKTFVEEWVRTANEAHEYDDWPFLVMTAKDETGKYGRYLVEIYRRSGGDNLSDALVAEFPEVAR